MFYLILSAEHAVVTTDKVCLGITHQTEKRFVGAKEGVIKSTTWDNADCT